MRASALLPAHRCPGAFVGRQQIAITDSEYLISRRRIGPGTGRFELHELLVLCTRAPRKAFVCAHPPLLLRIDPWGASWVGSKTLSPTQEYFNFKERKWSGRADLNCRTTRALHEAPREAFLFVRIRFCYCASVSLGCFVGRQQNTIANYGIFLISKKEMVGTGRF